MENFDVVIVGSGPAGAATANSLKDKGKKVLVVEKGKLPRYKMCSGFISPAAQKFISEHFGNIPEECYSQPRIIKGTKIFLSDRSVIDVPPEAYNEGENADILCVWRSHFDYWLAKESGAVLKDQCRFVKFQKDNGELIVTCTFRGKDIALRTRYLIGADGGNSTVRGVAIPNFDKQEFLTMAYEEHWTGTMDLDPDYFYLFQNEKFSERFFATLNVKDGKFVLVSSGRRGSNIRDLHKNFMDYLKNSHKFKPEKLVHYRGCVFNPAGGYKGHFDLGNDKVLLVGEAAGFMQASGEGITPALITGDMAGNALIKSMELGIEAIAAYSEMVEDEMKKIKAQHEQMKGFGV